MHLCVFEDDGAGHFLPLVHTRAVYDLRIGIRTVLRCLRDSFGDPPTILHARRQVASVSALENNLLINRIPEGLDVLFVNGRWVPEEGDLLDRVRAAARPEEDARVFVQDGMVLAAWVPNASSRFVEEDAVTAASFDGLPEESVEGARLISRLWSLQNELVDALERDYDHYLKGINVFERPGVDIKAGAVLAGSERIHIGKGSVIRPGAVLDAEEGPIYIGEDVTIHDLAVVKGPAYVGSKSVIMSGADIEACSFGYWCKVGGQVEESIIHSLSNKAHSGFLGNAYIGRWCNLGADTNVSNLKNDYGEVKMYDAVTGGFEGSGRQFLGVVMGDHTKSGINTMFNTGAVTGVCSNVFGTGFLPRFIPSFAWGGPEQFDEYRLDKALKVAETVMQRRERQLSVAEQENLAAVFEATRGETPVK